MSLNTAQVSLLIEALCDPASAYILGAGASAPDVPVMGELIRRVLTKFRDHVTGFVPGNEPEPTHYLFANAAGEKGLKEQLLASNIETFRMLIANELAPSDLALKVPPEQYRVLSMAPPNTRIINYNVDCLAGAHCPRAVVTAVHGEVRRSFVNRIPVEKLVILTQQGIRIEPEKSFWLPEPESEQELLHTIDPAYRSIRCAPYVVIIGYSFGMGPGGMADSVSLNALIEYYRDEDARVLIIDPSPRELSEVLQESLRNPNVVAMPVYWNLFCAAVLEVINEKALNDLGGLRRFTKDVVLAYRAKG